MYEISAARFFIPRANLRGERKVSAEKYCVWYNRLCCVVYYWLSARIFANFLAARRFCVLLSVGAARVGLGASGAGRLGGAGASSPESGGAVILS